jgi:hypothetical protein
MVRIALGTVNLKTNFFWEIVGKFAKDQMN